LVSKEVSENLVLQVLEREVESRHEWMKIQLY